MIGHILLGTLTSKLSLTVSVWLAWQPVRAVIVVAQEPVIHSQLTSDTLRNTDFMETGNRPATITLNGSTLTYDSSTLDVSLFWQSDRPAKRPFTTHSLQMPEKKCFRLPPQIFV